MFYPTSFIIYIFLNLLSFLFFKLEYLTIFLYLLFIININASPKKIIEAIKRLWKFFFLLLVLFIIISTRYKNFKQSSDIFFEYLFTIFILLIIFEHLNRSDFVLFMKKIENFCFFQNIYIIVTFIPFFFQEFKTLKLTINNRTKKSSFIEKLRTFSSIIKISLNISEKKAVFTAYALTKSNIRIYSSNKIKVLSVTKLLISYIICYLPFFAFLLFGFK